MIASRIGLMVSSVALGFAGSASARASRFAFPLSRRAGST